MSRNFSAGTWTSSNTGFVTNVSLSAATVSGFVANGVGLLSIVSVDTGGASVDLQIKDLAATVLAECLGVADGYTGAVTFTEVASSGVTGTATVVAITPDGGDSADLTVATQLVPVIAYESDTLPLGFWAFNGDLTDTSGGGFNTSVSSGTPTYTTGLNGLQAIQLPGTATTTWPVTTIANVLGQTTNGRTLHFFYKYTGTTQNSTVTFTARNNTASSQWTLTMKITPATPIWSIEFRSNASTVIGPITLASNVFDTNWHQVALVWEAGGSNVTRLYHDGALVGSTTTALSALNGLTTPILRMGDASTNAITLLTQAFVSKAMMPGDIALLYNSRLGRLLADWDATVANAPTLDTATPGDGIVSLAWSAPGSNGGSALTAYKVYRDGSLVHTTANAAVVTYDAAGTNGVSYAWTVKATNAVGDSAASNSISAAPAAAASAAPKLLLLGVG